MNTTYLLARLTRSSRISIRLIGFGVGLDQREPLRNVRDGEKSGHETELCFSPARSRELYMLYTPAMAVTSSHPRGCRAFCTIYAARVTHAAITIGRIPYTKEHPGKD